MEKSARFSSCQNYRYSLWRTWSGLLPNSRGYAMFVGLNPSTADETNDDPTIRRCMAFAKETLNNPLFLRDNSALLLEW